MNLNISISNVMTKEVTSVNPSQKLIDVKHIFEKKNFHHHIPVTENGQLKGMISLVDYLYAIKNASLNDDDATYHNLSVKDIMRENPVTKSSSSSLKEVTEELAKGEVHAILIADERKLKGIVSTADVMRFFLNTATG
jgi:acetoin utilization protein AcuB